MKKQQALETEKGTVVTFAGFSPLDIPEDATDVVFQQRNHGGYLLEYKREETRDPGSVILVSEQVRSIYTKIFYDREGTEEARSVVTSDWEGRKPSVDAAVAASGVKVSAPWQPMPGRG